MILLLLPSFEILTYNCEFIAASFDFRGEGLLSVGICTVEPTTQIMLYIKALFSLLHKIYFIKVPNKLYQ